MQSKYAHAWTTAYLEQQYLSAEWMVSDSGAGSTIQYVRYDSLLLLNFIFLIT